MKSIRRLTLIANYSTTDVAVLDPIGCEYSRVTASTVRGSSTHPCWCCDKCPCTWALLGGVPHVKVSNACPSSSAAAATHSVHVTVDLHCSSTGAPHPVVARGAVCRDCTARGCWASRHLSSRTDNIIVQQGTDVLVESHACCISELIRRAGLFGCI